MTGRLALLCSGQGAQSPTMFDLVADQPEAAPVFAAAALHLDGHDPRHVVRTAPEPDLFTNRAGQVLCCTAALALHAVLADRLPADTIVAGYSVGELAAWGCAGVFGVEQTLALARRRAALMDAAAPPRAGLVAVAGLRRAQLDPLLPPLAAVAIVLGPDRFVVGGPDDALAALADLARRHGATRATRLRVGVPSHTELLAEAATGFGRLLDGQPLGPVRARYRLFGSLDAEPVRDRHLGLAALAAQIRTTIEWSLTVASCREAGATRLLELGPGDALARNAGSGARAAADFRTLDGLRGWLGAPSRP